MAEREPKMKRRSTKLNRKEWVAGYLFLLPNLIGFLVFTAVPVIMGLVISMSDYSGFGKLNFIGIQNYIDMFQDSNFIISLKNNFFYTISTVPLTIFFSLLLALMLNRKLFCGNMFKTIYFFPNLTSMVAVGCVWLQLFQVKNGPVNQLLTALGVENPPKWFWGTSTAMASIVIVVVWKQAGYYMIMFLGGLKSIPAHLYEAAKIDGASALKTFRYITWPMLSPTTFMVTILTFIASFQVFDIINVTTEGGPGRETSVLVMRVYLEAFRYGKMGYAAAIGYFLFLIIFLLTIIQWRTQKKWVNEDT